MALREPSLLSLFIESGLQDPVPVIAQSEAHLLEILKDWQAQHPNDPIPEWTKSKAPRQSSQKCFFARTTTPISHTFLRFNHCFVRIAKGSDGSCMVIDSNSNNSCGWTGYHAWLGADLGFSDYTIIHTCERHEFEQQYTYWKRKASSVKKPNSKRESVNSSTFFFHQSFWDSIEPLLHMIVN